MKETESFTTEFGSYVVHRPERLPRDPGFVRLVNYTSKYGDGEKYLSHCSGRDDFSAEHDRQTNYSAKCGWCWLNASHSVEIHENRVKGEN